MNQETLQLFSQQLARWAETAIAHGRFPFRKVEVSPALLSNGGKISPPLVFWINRDSFMAGGVLLLPTGGIDLEIKKGRQCARILGLRHFVTWSSREIVFWEDKMNSAARHRTIPFRSGAQTAPGDFQAALGQILEELKILSVTGAIPPDELGADYFANLCRGAVLDSHPFLVGVYRVAEGEERLRLQSSSAAQQAYQKGLLSLLRILALILFDQLPLNVQPENLERAMRFALDSLPAEIRESLDIASEERTLPLESAVRFHHLFRRLSQLRWGQDRSRAYRVLDELVSVEGLKVGGHPLPFPLEAEVPGELRLFADRFYPAGDGLLEVGTAPLLAFTALLRSLAGLPPAARQTVDLFDLPASSPPARVRGTLSDRHIPTSGDRRVLTARLRVSWPTRRFTFPSKSPRWVWQFLHILGLAHPHAPIELFLPDDWLTADYGFFLWNLVKTQGALDFLSRASQGTLRLRLTKGGDRQEPTTITGPDSTRQLCPDLSEDAPRSLLPLALDLPEDRFALLEKGLLRFPEKSDWPHDREREVFLFGRSSWGGALWKIISGDAPLPGPQHLREAALRYGLPLPAEEILEEIRQLDWDGPEGEEPSQNEVDRQLAGWLGDAPPLLNRPREKAGRRAQRSPVRKISATSELGAEISREVFVDGVPRFPEHYLYDYYRPQLEEYHFSGPLVPEEEFFGQTVLCDSGGTLLQIENRETARALILASYSGRVPVGLPVDHLVTAAIVDRYLSDLVELRQSLIKITHVRLADARAADALAQRIWGSLALPPWSLLESEFSVRLAE